MAFYSAIQDGSYYNVRMQLDFFVPEKILHTRQLITTCLFNYVTFEHDHIRFPLKLLDLRISFKIKSFMEPAQDIMVLGKNLVCLSNIFLFNDTWFIYNMLFLLLQSKGFHIFFYRKLFTIFIFTKNYFILLPYTPSFKICAHRLRILLNSHYFIKKIHNCPS